MTFSIGRNIRAERVRCGLTQLEMARKLGLSATGYNHKENGRRQLTLEEFVLICKILGANPDTLIRKSD
ncbi:MAG: helix-turn-helix transcriptional regulator [Syntrophomonadaceae bacterium]|jgi:transcriptional regulator with XRE-family HTH domain